MIHLKYTHLQKNLEGTKHPKCSGTIPNREHNLCNNYEIPIFLQIQSSFHIIGTGSLMHLPIHTHLANSLSPHRKPWLLLSIRGHTLSEWQIKTSKSFLGSQLPTISWRKLSLSFVIIMESGANKPSKQASSDGSITLFTEY